MEGKGKSFTMRHHSSVGTCSIGAGTEIFGTEEFIRDGVLDFGVGSAISGDSVCVVSVPDSRTGFDGLFPISVDDMWMMLTIVRATSRQMNGDAVHRLTESIKNVRGFELLVFVRSGVQTGLIGARVGLP
jgi:hypothetical protein